MFCGLCKFKIAIMQFLADNLRFFMDCDQHYNMTSHSIISDLSLVMKKVVKMIY